MVPSVEECRKFMKKYQMLDNIQAHSLMVAKVARIIALELRNAGESVSVDVAIAGALMHDIAKTPCLISGEDHAALGRKICLENGLIEIADIVGQHVRLKDYSPEREISEKEIVYYADKRVNHDHIVHLEDRLRYLLDRYGKNIHSLKDRIRRNFELACRVEEKLFLGLTFGPEDVGGLVDALEPL